MGGVGSASSHFARFLKAAPPAYRTARKVRHAVGSRLPPRNIAGIPGRVHRNDLMLADGSAQSAAVYASVGREAVELIDQALREAGRSFADGGRGLDFGCGHGRVLRWLVQRLDPSSVTCCDLDPEAVAFCASEFGATPLVSNQDFELADTGPFDLIWAGSLATHLPEEAWFRWSKLAGRLLGPRGVVVFTTHAPALAAADRYLPDMGRHADELSRALKDTGFAYRPYTHYGHDGYGVAFHDPDRVERDMASVGLSRVLFRPKGWDSHQDLHAFWKP